MTVTLELPPEFEAQIAAEPEYLVAVIQERSLRISAGLETYLLSESAVAKDWLWPEENEAWQHL